MVDPQLVMLDEPMAGVNPALVQSLLEHIRELRGEGRTVVFVEHDMDVVMNISDWVVCMAQGQVIAEAPPAAIVTDESVIDAYLGTHHGERPGTTRGGAVVSLFEAQEVVAGYIPGVDILHGSNLVVADGELVGIIGPNGAGKSTLLKAMFGLVPVRSGRVLLRGEDITRARANDLVERGVGYVPQVRNVFATMTVDDNLRMGAYLRPKEFRDRRDRVDRAVAAPR